jgi:peptidoglycan-N-acetylglucosamine deacetylase
MRLALTIDAEHPDCPTRDPLGNAERLLDCLDHEDVRASFFVQGAWAQSNPVVVSRMVKQGHLIGSHSYSHCTFPRMRPEGMIQDLQDSRAALRKVGVDAENWFRLPGGRGNDEVMSAVGTAGFKHVGWTVMAGDFDSSLSATEVARRVISDVDRLRPDGVSVAVFHSWPDSAPEAFALVLSSLLGSVDFVRLDELNPNEIPRGVEPPI